MFPRTGLAACSRRSGRVAWQQVGQAARMGAPAVTTHLATRQFALSRPELATTAAAVVASSALFLRYGHPYLARGVVGDLCGLVALTLLGRRWHARARHEVLWCAVGIGLVVGARPEWPLRLPDPLWWLVIAGALAGYLRLRRTLCSMPARQDLPA